MYDLQIGDQVRILEYDLIKRRNEFPHFTPVMKNYCGKTFTIQTVYSDCGEDLVEFREIGYVWRTEWVEPPFNINVNEFEKFLMGD